MTSADLDNLVRIGQLKQDERLSSDVLAATRALIDALAEVHRG